MTAVDGTRTVVVASPTEGRTGRLRPARCDAVGRALDPALGPLITLGVGGRLAEVYKDATTRVAPVDLAEARDMIETVRGLASIRGWRGQPAGDLDGLAALIVALSRLALIPSRPIAEAEINPIIVLRDHVTAVDGLVVLKPPG